MAIDKLEEQGYLSPEKNFLIFHLYVRAPTFAQHARDQARYIQLLTSNLPADDNVLLFPAE